MAVPISNLIDNSHDISFPLTKYSLWDSKPIGPSTCVNLLPKHNLFVHLSEKLLNILRFSLSQCNKSELIVDFITSLEFSKDENLIFNIERFHHIKNNENLPIKNNLEFHIQGKIYNNYDSAINKDELSVHIKEIEGKLSSEKLLFNFFNFLSVNIIINILSSELEDNLFKIDICTTYISNTFIVVPVKPLPFVSTALSNYLLSTNQSKQSININKHGFLSMDQTRKLLLILESDPKVLSLPLVGVWTCAVDNINHALVAANLIRYVFNPVLKNKICQSMKSFLLVLFPASFGGVEFYQCSVNSKDKQFNVLSAIESVSIDRFKSMANGLIEIELKLYSDTSQQQINKNMQISKDDNRLELFNQNISANKNFSINNKSNELDINHFNSDDNLNNYNRKIDVHDSQIISTYNNLPLNFSSNNHIKKNDDVTPRSLPANFKSMQEPNKFQELFTVPDVTLLSDYNMDNISKCDKDDILKDNNDKNDNANVNDSRPQSTISNNSYSKHVKSVIQTLKSSTQSLNICNNINKNSCFNESHSNINDMEYNKVSNLTSKQDLNFDLNLEFINQAYTNKITPNTRIMEHAKEIENKTNNISKIKNINLEEISLKDLKNKYLQNDLQTISPISNTKTYPVENKSTPIIASQTVNNPVHSTPINLPPILNMNELTNYQNTEIDNQSNNMCNDQAQNSDKNNPNINHSIGLNNLSDTSCETSLKKTLVTLVPQSIPIELYNLLLEQSKELKELRREIDILRSEKKQEIFTNANSKEIHVNSVGTNTSLLLLNSNLPNNINYSNYNDVKFQHASKFQSNNDNGIRVIDIIGPSMLNQMQNTKNNPLILNSNDQKCNIQDVESSAFKIQPKKNDSLDSKNSNYNNDNDSENNDEDDGLNINESFDIELPNNDQENSIFPTSKQFQILEYHSNDSSNGSISQNSNNEYNQINQNKEIKYDELITRVQNLLSRGNKLTEGVDLYPNNQDYKHKNYKSQTLRVNNMQHCTTKNERILNFNSKSNNSNMHVSEKIPKPIKKNKIDLKNNIYASHNSNNNEYSNHGNYNSKNKEKTNEKQNESSSSSRKTFKINSSKINKYVNDYSNSSEDKDSSRPKLNINNEIKKRNTCKDTDLNNLKKKNENNNNYEDSCSKCSDENSSSNSIDVEDNNSGSEKFVNNYSNKNGCENSRVNHKNVDSGNANGKQLFDVNNHLRRMGLDINYDENKRMYGEASILLPRLSYPSFFNHQSGSEISQHVDALALKYLTEEQIESLTKLQKYHNKQKQDLNYNQIDRPINTPRKSDISRYGLPLEKMSFYSRDYLEKYGLLSNPNSPIKNTNLDVAKSKNRLKDKSKKQDVQAKSQKTEMVDKKQVGNDNNENFHKKQGTFKNHCFDSTLPSQLLDIEKLRAMPKLL